MKTFNRSVTIAGVADRGMGTGAVTDLDITRAGMAVLTARDRAIGMAIAVTAIIAMAIVAIMTVGGIRSPRSALEQSLAVRLPRRPRRQSTAHLLTVTATRMSGGVIIVIGPIGRLIIHFSRIMVHVSSVIRHIDSGDLSKLNEAVLYGRLCLFGPRA